MKKTYIILYILPFFLFTAINAQESTCLNDTIKLTITEFRGEHYWQQSTNGSDWSRIDDYQGDTLTIITSENQFYRFEVLEGNCIPIYSDIVELIVHNPPVVVLNDIDSVCINESNILLSSGTPTGGTYWGNQGITDGRFIPALAGAGSHSYFYKFADPVTLCSDTAMAYIEVLPLPSIPLAGEDLLEIIQDSVQLNGNSPEIGNGYWEIIEGEGGYFSDSTLFNTWFFKGPENNAYKLLWTIKGKCGTNNDELDLIFLRLSKNPCPGTPVVFDSEGTMYPTLQIGNQCWMSENLNTGIYIASTETSRAHSDASDNGIIEKYLFDNNEANAALYGGLYDWDEMMNYSEEPGSQGICPEGWHIPSNDDWEELNDFYENRDPGLHLKEGGDSGFEGKLAGDRHNQGFFVSFGSSGFFWSSNTYSYNGANDGYIRELCACNDALEKVHFSKKTAVSVRCIKD